ncbi:hypothetical protein ASD32_22390 [Rhizobium sp. Root483D2]|nr:hypothetical protein ASD32_22390 [Rhizobium sp. Root483D2]
MGLLGMVGFGMGLAHGSVGAFAAFAYIRMTAEWRLCKELHQRAAFSSERCAQEFLQLKKKHP